MARALEQQHANLNSRQEGVEMMKPVAGAVAGALISGAVMYAVGAKTAQVDAFQTPELVQAAPVRASAPHVAPTRTAYRSAAPQVQERVVPQVEEPVAVNQEVASPDTRSWKKTAMIIGGSAASGAGVGGIIKGKKGALIGAAIGGGAASIYEATRRR